MKKLIGMVLMAMLLMTPSASATILDNTNACWATGIHTCGINNDPYDQAEMLNQLGLFGGTEKGFELERCWCVFWGLKTRYWPEHGIIPLRMYPSGRTSISVGCIKTG